MPIWRAMTFRNNSNLFIVLQQEILLAYQKVDCVSWKEKDVKFEYP